MLQNIMSLVRVHIGVTDIDVQVPGVGPEAIETAKSTVRKANLRVRGRKGSIYTQDRKVDIKAHVVATHTPKVGERFTVPTTKIIKIHS